MKHEQNISSFHHRLDQKILEAGLSYRELSVRIGRGETYISSMVRNRNDPGLSTVIEICNVLGIELAELVDCAPAPMRRHVSVDGQDINDFAEMLIAAAAKRARDVVSDRGINPTIDEVIEWWYLRGGLLEDFDTLRDKVDLFAPPPSDASMPVPVRIGSDSLVSRKFSLHNEDHLRNLLPRLETVQTARIASAHLEALSGHPVLSIEQIQLFLPERNENVHARYKRLLLPVRDPRGDALVLNYSQLIG